MHALIAVVDRLLVLHGGGFIAEGDPQTVIQSPAVREIYMGIPRRCLSRCSRCGRSTPITATSRRCSASRSRVAAGRGGRGHRRQRRRQIDAAQVHRRRHAHRGATRSCSTASRSATCRPMRWSARGIALVPEGRRLFPSLIGRGEPADRRPARPARAVEPRRASTSCSRCWRSAATCRAPRCPAASSRWSRSAAR